MFGRFCIFWSFEPPIDWHLFWKTELLISVLARCCMLSSLQQTQSKKIVEISKWNVCRNTARANTEQVRLSQLLAVSAEAVYHTSSLAGHQRSFWRAHSIINITLAAKTMNTTHVFRDSPAPVACRHVRKLPLNFNTAVSCSFVWYLLSNYTDDWIKHNDWRSEPEAATVLNVTVEETNWFSLYLPPHRRIWDWQCLQPTLSPAPGEADRLDYLSSSIWCALVIAKLDQVREQGA